MTTWRTLQTSGVLAGACMLPMAALASEPECFRTPAEAAARSGLHDAAGFRLESVERDAFADLRWARVRSCAQPGRPLLLIPLAAGVQVSAALERAAGQEVSLLTRSAALPLVAALPLAVRLEAGRRVTLVIRDESTRVEVGAVALASAAVGQRVRVRIEQIAAGSEERIAEGIVRGPALVEVTR